MSRETAAQMKWIALTLALAAVVVWGGFATGSTRKAHGIGCCVNARVGLAADTRVPMDWSDSEPAA